MRKILLFGNSGSGKSTLAKFLCQTDGLSHLDLDTLAWQATEPPQRSALETCNEQINNFIQQNPSWVIEGCYTDLLELAEPFASEVIFLNPPIEVCIQNARNRPWEPHKYPSKAAQDANLEMLVEWIAQYPHRKDIFSEQSHQDLYERFQGKRTIYTQDTRNVNH